MYTLILFLNLLTVVSSVMLAVFAFRNRQSQTAFLFFILMLVFSLWSLGKIALLFVHSLQNQIVIEVLIRSISIFTPALILNIVVSYTHYPSWVGHRQIYILYLFTAALSILSLLSLGDFFSRVFVEQYSLQYVYDLPNLKIQGAPGLMLLLFHLYFCLIAAIIILIRNLFINTVYFKKQIVLILVALALPAVNDAFYWLGFSLIPDYHLVTVSFSVGNIFFAYAIFYHQFLRIGPVARNIVIDSIRDIMITVNSQGRIVDINKSAESLLEVRGNQIVGFFFKDVFSKRPGLLQLFKEKKNRVITLSTGGLDRHYSGSVAGVHSSHDEMVAEVLLLHDISRSIRARKKIREKEKRFRLIFENSHNGVILINTTGEYITVNPAFSRITGYSEQELAGRPIGNLTHPEDRSRIKSTLERLLQAKVDKYTDEFRIVSKNNCILWVSAAVTPYYNLDNIFEFLLVEIVDITGKKDSEQKLQKYASDLEKSNASKDKFFSIIAHDLRNPFNGLIGLSEALLEDFSALDEESALSIIRHIHNSSLRGYQLLNNLLEWSRMQTGDIHCQGKVFIFLDLVQEALEIEKINYNRKEISVDLSIEADIEVYADTNMVYSVVRNLIANAIKYTRQGGHIEIAAWQQDLNYIHASISDNGVGISEKNKNKLFHIENKISTPGTNQEKGSGLGLILCQEFIKKNNGQIWLTSIENKGTTITFSLPKNETVYKNHKYEG